MIELARVTATSTVAAYRFFERWCDLDTHPEWAPGMEYLRLDEPFGVGARGMLKIAGQEARPFEISAVVPDSVYADTTILDGARLTITHVATTIHDGSGLELIAIIEGERADAYLDELGDIDDALAGDLGRLIALLESQALAGGE